MPASPARRKAARRLRNSVFALVESAVAELAAAEPDVDIGSHRRFIAIWIASLGIRLQHSLGRSLDQVNAISERHFGIVERGVCLGYEELIKPIEMPAE